MNSNMINPANYFNPFAKYSTVNKTSRGVYIPKDSEPLLNLKIPSQKSTSIFSENYDAETDIMSSIESENNNSTMTTWLNNLFKNNKDK